VSSANLNVLHLSILSGVAAEGGYSIGCGSSSNFEPTDYSCWTLQRILPPPRLLKNKKEEIG
jgi:hypothetical protein